MNPAVILGQIIDTMRNDHATGEAGEIMIKGLECLLAVDLAMTVERAQQFLLLGIDAQNRVPRREKLLDEMAQMAKLRVALRRVTTRQDFGDLATGQPERIEQASDNVGASTDAVGVQAVGNLLGRQIRPQHVVTHGVASDPFLDRVLHVLEQCWVFGFRLLPSASWFANALARRIIGQLLELSDAFLDGVRIASQDVRNVCGPTMAQGERFDGRKAAAVLFREALVVLPQQLFDVRSVVLLKVKRHDGSSRSQVLPAMGGADQEVFMNRNRNARANELGIYFGAMPRSGCGAGVSPVAILCNTVLLLPGKVSDDPCSRCVSPVGSGALGCPPGAWVVVPSCLRGTATTGRCSRACTSACSCVSWRASAVRISSSTRAGM